MVRAWTAEEGAPGGGRGHFLIEGKWNLESGNREGVRAGKADRGTSVFFHSTVHSRNTPWAGP